MLSASGQPDAARAVGDLVDALGADEPRAAGPGADAEPVDQLVDLAERLERGDATALVGLSAAVARFAPTGSAPGRGPGGRRLGHDLAASAALVQACRALVVAERGTELALLPVFPDAWFGNGLEVHDLPTELGQLSFAIRWHGTRPALLWDLSPHPGEPTVTLTVPGLDPSWSTTEVRGDALLAEVAPPEGIDLVREVAEHPDIDPAMRRPGREPEARERELPEGGSFS
jgi:hypothetical protein